MHTTYLGMELRSPLVASAGPLTRNVDQVERMADTGLGAVVLHSMFAERLRREAARDADLEESYEESSAEATSYFPSSAATADPGHSYLSLVERSAAAIEIPLIASLNAAEVGSWVTYAKQLVDAGASAIEANIYLVPGNLAVPGSEVEARHLEIVSAVTEAVDLPVAVKLSPYFSSVGNFALQLVQAGAAGLVLFNRFLQPRVDVAEMAVVPGIQLSAPVEGQIARTWIASLRNQTSASLAATSGVESAEDVIAYLLTGADVVMTTSALVRHGVDYATRLIGQVTDWMFDHDFGSVSEFRGKLAVPAEADGNAYARSGYLAALEAAQDTYGSLT